MNRENTLKKAANSSIGELKVTAEQTIDRVTKLIENIETVVIGKHDVIVRAVAALLSDGHILIEDVPGVGKTMLAKAIAKSISGEFRRVQFTADLLPSDITGVNIFQQDTGEFRFRRGAIFTNVLLGDEINRATPRTQSSLLEAMEEQQVTVDGERFPLRRPFFVIATQNPIELEGTYPLPFAQMDRFIVRLRIGYLDSDIESKMLRTRMTENPIAACQHVISCDDLADIQRLVQRIRVSDDLLDYIVAIIHKTRDSAELEYGASPRGSLDLMRYSQALAFIDRRDYVLPDDIKEAAGSVLAHRVIVKKGTRHATLNIDSIIQSIVESVDVPV